MVLSLKDTHIHLAQTVNEFRCLSRIDQFCGLSGALHWAGIDLFHGWIPPQVLFDTDDSLLGKRLVCPADIALLLISFCFSMTDQYDLYLICCGI